MKYLIFLSALLTLSIAATAQHAHFATVGEIEFERKVNMHAVLRKKFEPGKGSFYEQAYNQYKATQPQFMTMKSTLRFSKDKTLFTPLIGEKNPAANFLGDDPTTQQVNTIYSDVSSGLSVTAKKVYDETFLIKDTTRHINWKITDETREIAGYACRRANAVILDSIYVVAFYTVEIPVSGGPESFSGLPGMILGVALPHDNVSWFATKVTEQAVPPASLAAPAKGKVVNNAGFQTAIKALIKNWGDYGKEIVKALMI
jgi:GLPGLI family protein